MRLAVKTLRLVGTIACVVWLTPPQESLFANEIAPPLKVELSAEQKDVDTIAAWIVRHNGTHTISLQGDVAKLLGLSSNTKDFDVLGVSFSNTESRSIFTLYPGHPEMVMAYGGKAATVYWLIKDGMLAKTAYFAAHRVEIIPNDKYLETYTKLLNFFLGKATGTDTNP